MGGDDLRLYELVPKPCIHDAAGVPHRSWSAMLACLDANGVPGFLLTPNGG